MKAVAETRADIDVTPLIDVMLVLLIIFMVLMPIAHHTLETRMPSAASDEPPGPPPVSMAIAVGPGLSLNGHAVAGLADLCSRLEAALAVRADRTVFVRSNGDVTYGRVVEAMGTARAAGAERLGLLTGRDQLPSSRNTRNP